MRVLGRKLLSRPLAALSAFLVAACGIPDLGPDFVPRMTAFVVVSQGPSYSALYDDQASLTEPLLPGHWVQVGSLADWHWSFEDEGEDGYRLGVGFFDDPAILHMKVVRLGTQRFADIQVVEPALVTSDGTILELHGIFKLTVRADSVKLAPLSQAWLQEKSERGELEIGHEVSSTGMITLDAPTDKLRAFVLHASSDPRAFPDPTADGPGFDLLRRMER